MLLEKLREYSELLDDAPAMYAVTPIRWVIELDWEGGFKGVSEAAGFDLEKNRPYVKTFLAPAVVRSSAIKPKLFADNPEYVLGTSLEGDEVEGRAGRRHDAFKRLAARCASETSLPEAIAVKSFYASYSPGDLSLPDGFKAGDQFTFRVEGVYPIDLPGVREFWAEVTSELSDLDEAFENQCLVCGEVQQVVERQPVRIKGIPGGQTSGASLVSANAPAFESYGLDASYTAPICHECGERFGNALNELIADKKTHVTVGPTVYVCWTRGKRRYNLAGLLSDPDPEDVSRFMAEMTLDRKHLLNDDSRFYCAALSASGGRVVVRDWLVTTLGQVRRNLTRYFRLQALVERDGLYGPPMRLSELASTTVYNADTLPPNVPMMLLRFALNGGELPSYLAVQALRRVRADMSLPRPRAALIKMYLMSRGVFLDKEGIMEKLDKNVNSAAYLCGRLFGVLESIKRAAMPIKHDYITDRAFVVAATSPASVFGRMMKRSQDHITKLRREKPGTCRSLVEEVVEITGRLNSFPPLLNIEEQGLFALGYYHEKAHRNAALSRDGVKRTGSEARA